MTRKIIAAMVLSLAMGGAAVAQNSGTGGTGSGAPGANDPMKTTTQGMDPAVGNAFFTDSTMGTMRSDAEIKANWANLSSEQQAKVKQDCSNMSASAAPVDKGATASTSAGASSGTVTGQQGSATAGGSAAGGGNFNAKTMADLCASVRRCNWRNSQTQGPSRKRRAFCHLFEC